MTVVRHKKSGKVLCEVETWRAGEELIAEYDAENDYEVAEADD